MATQHRPPWPTASWPPHKPAEAVAIYRHLRKTRTAPTERPVRAAAERALARAK